MLILHTVPPQMNCTASLPPPRNGTISGHSVPAIPGTRVAFQCDDGLFPEGIMTATCLATGEWDRNTGEIVCRGKRIHYLHTLVIILFSPEPPTAALCNCASLSDGVNLMQLSPSVWLSRQLYSQSLDC